MSLIIILFLCRHVIQLHVAQYYVNGYYIVHVSSLSCGHMQLERLSEIRQSTVVTICTALLNFKHSELYPIFLHVPGLIITKMRFIA